MERYSMYLAVSSGTNSFLQFFTLIIVFALVLFLTYWTTRFIGNYQKTAGKTTNFDIIETYRISNTKYIQIIRVGKKYLAVSVCKDSITTLAELSEEEIVIPQVTNNMDSFSKILEKVKNGKGHTQEGKEQNHDKDKENE